MVPDRERVAEFVGSPESVTLSVGVRLRVTEEVRSLEVDRVPLSSSDFVALCETMPVELTVDEDDEAKVPLCEMVRDMLGEIVPAEVDREMGTVFVLTAATEFLATVVMSSITAKKVACTTTCDGRELRDFVEEVCIRHRD